MSASSFATVSRSLVKRCASFRRGGTQDLAGDTNEAVPSMPVKLPVPAGKEAPDQNATDACKPDQAETAPPKPAKTNPGSYKLRVRSLCGHEVEVTVAGDDVDALQLRDLKKAIPKEFLDKFPPKSCLQFAVGPSVVDSDNVLLSDLPDATTQGFTVVATNLRKLDWEVEGMGPGSSHWTPFADEGRIVKGELHLKEPLFKRDFDNPDLLKDHIIELIYADKNLPESDRAILLEEQLKPNFPFVLFYNKEDQDGALISARFKMVD